MEARSHARDSPANVQRTGEDITGTSRAPEPWGCSHGGHCAKRGSERRRLGARRHPKAIQELVEQEKEGDTAHGPRLKFLEGINDLSGNPRFVRLGVE